MDESLYTTISQMLERGASLDEVQELIDARTRGADDEERSAAWLVDWYAWEHGGRRPGERAGEAANRGLEPLE
jgi:hypothetical protein